MIDIRECETQPLLRETSDHALIEQAFLGDSTAFELVVGRYHAALYNFIGRCLGDYEQAKDVLQFVFIQLYVSIPKLHNNLYSLRSKLPLKSWLFQVAWNRCMDELRKKRPVLFSELELVEEEDLSVLDAIPDPYPLPEEVAEQDDLRGSLFFAIQSLPPKFRSVVLLRYREELSFSEIGLRLNMPENTAKTYFQRARPLLRASLNSQVEFARVS
jgi:RNA polymerase sigma factor (sigma-70 family)